MVEAQRNHALAREVEGTKGGYARPRLVEPQQGVVRTLADVLRHAAERRDTRGRRPTLPAPPPPAAPPPPPRPPRRAPRAPGSPPPPPPPPAGGGGSFGAAPGGGRRR